jgi:hypothetical protein
MITPQILKHNKSQQTSMHQKEIELNYDKLCQQILGLESEILWLAGSMPTFTISS